MSREFLVWFAPAANGVFWTFAALVLVSCFSAPLILIKVFDTDEEEDKRRWSRRFILAVVLTVVFGLAMAAINPLTMGPKCYDEAHKTPQQVEKP